VQYWDTSALLKVYVAEPDSSAFLQLLASTGAPILTSAVAGVELQCALYRKQMAGDLKEGGAHHAFQKFKADVTRGRIVSVPLGDDISAASGGIIRSAFSGRRPVMVRSLDVIHLASAAVGGAETLVATDLRLREAAKRAGFKLAPPEDL
jgi:predicted nucleic acid-binding protein